jgi:hypothetical protein
MKFRNYCIVIMGDTKNVLPEIVKISETKPNILDSKGILIATFASIAEPKEITDYFKLNGRNFLVFDLNEENSGAFISKKEINDGLFGFLKEFNNEVLKQKTEELMTTIDIEMTSTTVSSKSRKLRTEFQVSIEEIYNMSPKEKNELMNKLIDKGAENLSEYDKKILNMLSI